MIKSFIELKGISSATGSEYIIYRSFTLSKTSMVLLLISNAHTSKLIGQRIVRLAGSGSSSRLRCIPSPSTRHRHRYARRRLWPARCRAHWTRHRLLRDNPRRRTTLASRSRGCRESTVPSLGRRRIHTTP